MDLCYVLSEDFEIAMVGWLSYQRIRAAHQFVGDFDPWSVYGDNT